MTKKISIAFALIWFIFGITKVNALTQQENIKIQKNEIIDFKGIIETKINGQWEEFHINQYEAADMVIYEIGNNSAGANILTIGQKQETDSANTVNSKLVRILRYGYGYGDEKGFELTQDELYLATNMAINCMKKQYLEGTVGNYYRAKSGLDANKKEKISHIIEVANRLLSIGYSGEEMPKERIEVLEKGEFSRDKQKENFYSQTYEVRTKGVDLEEFAIDYSSDSPIHYYIGDENGEEMSRFVAPERNFKIMIPEEEAEEICELKVGINVTYQADRLFSATGNGKQYLVYGKARERKTVETSYDNKYSTLTINLVDEDTGEKLYGSIIEAKYTRITFVKENQRLEEKFGKEVIPIRIVWLPGDYIIPETDYMVELGYKEERTETIKVTHYKGKLLVKTNVSGASYRLYNANHEYQEYITDDVGDIYIENLRTGTYTLKQIEVPIGYEIAEEVEFRVTSYEPTVIKVENKKKEILSSGNVTQRPTGIPPKKEEDKPIENQEGMKEEKPDISDNNQELLEKLKNQQEIQVKEAENLKIARLPKTGTDYFFIKLFFSNFTIVMIITILIRKKKTD